MITKHNHYCYIMLSRLRNTSIGFILILFSCRSSSNAPIIESKQTASTLKLITEKEVYDFMEIVIKEQKLHADYGLSEEPELNCDLIKEDSEFLKELLLDTTKNETVTDTTDWQPLTLSYTGGQLDKCLTDDDIEFMLRQKIDNSNFKWNNSKLGFNLNNDSTFYVFSIPLFSKDKTKAVMMIRELCKGLCGWGWTILFKKENGTWTSQTGNQWVH